MNYKYKGKVYTYEVEELGRFVAGSDSDWIRITCEEVGLKSEFLKEDLQEALEFLKLYINMSLEEDYTSVENIKVGTKSYKAKVHRLGKQKDGQVWVKVICKGANYNQKHPKTELQKVLGEVLPHLIDIQSKSRKTATFQLRMTSAEKLKITSLAKRAGLNITEYLLKQALSV